MQQIVDLEKSSEWQDLDVDILSIAFDSAEQQWPAQQELGIQAPMLVDNERAVSTQYEVLQWASGSGEPGHTFVLVGADGMIKWVRDYGAAKNGGSMYVEVPEMVAQVRASLP